MKIWRVYNNGSIKNETHVLRPHGGFKGYGGDVALWSKNNKEMRSGCAQIMQEEGKDPVILYEGYLNAERLQPTLDKIISGEIK